ncbi:MAG: permease, partial [Candidatus Limnocylindria bacterium]
GGSIVLGLAGGLVAYLAERAGLLDGQARFSAASSVAAPALALAETSADSTGSSGCATPLRSSSLSIGPGAASVAEFRSIDRWHLRVFAGEAWRMGRMMLALFLGFAAIGYAIIALVPTTWLTTFLGGSNPSSTVLAATLGIPFYISTEASLPLVASLMKGGLGTGPAMAFLVTGAGTSVAAVTGGLLIARWRVLAIVVVVLWIGAIGLGLATTALGL